MWNAQWLPWGNVFAITGTANLDARFPGQWFQLESGLHYNWYRHYDPTIGRFTQPDPLGFVDGPSVYGYAGSSPHRFVDADGRLAGSMGSTGVGGTTMVALGFNIGRNLNQSTSPQDNATVQQCGIKDWITLCKAEIAALPANLRRNARMVVLACVAAIGGGSIKPPNRPTAHLRLPYSGAVISQKMNCLRHRLPLHRLLLRHHRRRSSARERQPNRV